MKVADKLKPYEEPPQPENTTERQNVRLWREHYIYNAAEADAYAHLLQLFENDMTRELRQWLIEAQELRRKAADEAHGKSAELSLKLWRQR